MRNAETIGIAVVLSIAIIQIHANDVHAETIDEDPISGLLATDLVEADSDPTGTVFLEQQISRGEADVALLQLEVMIQQIEAIHHRYHEDLIEPLTLLGDAQTQLGQTDEAIDTYGRARHVARVSKGLFSEEQLPIVYRESALFQQIGDLKSAGQREEYAYEIARRIHAGPVPQAIPAITRLASFYIQTNNPISARTLLMSGLAIHERNGTDTNPEAVPLLKGIAQTHMQTRFPPFYVTESSDNRLEGPTPSLNTRDLDAQHIVVNSFPQGERALQKIVEIQRKHFSDDPERELNAILELADWHLLFERFQAADTLYSHIYTKMAEHNLNPEGLFSTPTLLYFPRPENPRRGSRSESDPLEGLVSLQFNVNKQGRIRALKTVASEPPKLMDFRVRRSMRVARYRPQYVEGEAVLAEAHTFTYRFPYFPLRQQEQSGEESASSEQASTNANADTESAPVQE